ncbi:MAG: N-acetylmuramoyl-L-alanine amidase [Planctomycetes bacterium]|nr:N-acetylmuramoyl-L-alanine amidase [Planctomycetota bacterium]
MRNLTWLAPAIALLVAAGTACAGEGDPRPALQVRRLASLYGMKEEKALPGGRTEFSGNGHVLIVAPLCPGALMDGRFIPLDPPPTGEAEGMAVRGNALEALTEALVAAMVGPPPAVSVPAPAPSASPAGGPAPADDPPATVRKIVIDPGHGGDFDGARGRQGLLEKTVTLDVSRRLADLLRRHGIQVVLTRDSDRHLSSNLREDLKRRVDLSNHESPDCFISIHANYAASPAVRGYEVYTGRPEAVDERARPPAAELDNASRRLGADAPDDPSTRRALFHALQREFRSESRELAESIRVSFRGLPTEDRGVKTAGFYVLKWAEVPAVLVELDFISNPEVEKRLGNPTHRQELAERLARAVGTFDRELAKTCRETR